MGFERKSKEWIESLTKEQLVVYHDRALDTIQRLMEEKIKRNKGKEDNG